MMKPKLSPKTPILHFDALTIVPGGRGFGTAGRSVPLLAGIDLALGEGEVLVVAGESGAGKSLLCHLALGGLPRGLRRRGGTIRYRGRDLFEMKARDRKRIRSRELVHLGPREEAPFLPGETVASAIAEMRTAARSREADAHFEEALHALGFVEIEQSLELTIATLPTLDLKRLWLLRALLGEVGALVLDDPFVDLDPVATERLRSDIRRLAEKLGVGVLLATGRPLEAVGIADRLAILFEGRILEEGAPAALLSGTRFGYTSGFLRALPRAGSRRHLPGEGSISPDAIREAREHLAPTATGIAAGTVDGTVAGTVAGTVDGTAASP